jgi:hypothetical protein
MRSPLGLALALVLALSSFAAEARAELAPWDQARVNALAQQLADKTRELYDAIYRQPQPVAGTQRKDYFKLKREVRHLKNEARDFAGDVASGAGREETEPGFEALMSSARWAAQEARSVFTVKQVNDLAAEARGLLNELAAYYDPDAPLPPPRRR